MSDPRQQYRLLADENFPGPSVRLLRAWGYDVIFIAEVAPRLPDEHVLARARRTDRVLLTFDSDHGQLIFKAGESPPSGVVYFRVDPVPPERPALLLRLLVDDPGFVIEGLMTVIRNDGRVSQTPLPQETTADDES